MYIHPLRTGQGPDLPVNTDTEETASLHQSSIGRMKISFLNNPTEGERGHSDGSQRQCVEECVDILASMQLILPSPVAPPTERNCSQTGGESLSLSYCFHGSFLTVLKCSSGSCWHFSEAGSPVSSPSLSWSALPFDRHDYPDYGTSFDQHPARGKSGDGYRNAVGQHRADHQLSDPNPVERADTFPGTYTPRALEPTISPPEPAHMSLFDDQRSVQAAGPIRTRGRWSPRTMSTPFSSPMGSPTHSEPLKLTRTVQRRAPAQRGPNSNTKYTQEQVDYIMYLNADKELEWGDTVSMYMEKFGHIERGLSGCQAVYYRANKTIPMTDANGLLVFNKWDDVARQECKVREQQQTQGKKLGLLDTYPERAIEYDWVEPSDKARVWDIGTWFTLASSGSSL
jgi:hypothetical protein